MSARTYSFMDAPSHLGATHTFEVTGDDWKTCAVVTTQSPTAATVMMNHGQHVTLFQLVPEDFAQLKANGKPAAFEKVACVKIGRPGVAFAGDRFIVFDWRWALGPSDAERHSALSRFGFTIPVDLAMGVFQAEDLSASLAASAICARWIFRHWVDGRLADFNPG